MGYLPASVSALDRKSLQVQSSLASLLTYLSTGRLPISRRKRRVICGVACGSRAQSRTKVRSFALALSALHLTRLFLREPL